MTKANPQKTLWQYSWSHSSALIAETIEHHIWDKRSGTTDMVPEGKAPPYQGWGEHIINPHWKQFYWPSPELNLILIKGIWTGSHSLWKHSSYVHWPVMKTVSTRSLNMCFSPQAREMYLSKTSQSISNSIFEGCWFRNNIPAFMQGVGPDDPWGPWEPYDFLFSLVGLFLNTVCFTHHARTHHPPSIPYRTS